MKLTPLGIDGAWVAESSVWSDDRGFFREWFRSDEIKKVTGRDFKVEQANVSLSSAGTLRGIHYSIAPRGQAKWITCVSGSIQDVIVDIRPDSATFGQWVDVGVKSDSGKAIFVSEGLGHGFLALEDNTTVAYLVSSTFSPNHEYEINPHDEAIGIKWRDDLLTLKISDKDKNAPTLAQQLTHRLLPEFN